MRGCQVMAPMSPPAMTNHSATQTSMIFSPPNNSTSNNPAHSMSLEAKPVQNMPLARKTSFIKKKGSVDARSGRNANNAMSRTQQTAPVITAFYPQDRIDLETFYKRTMMQSVNDFVRAKKINTHSRNSRPKSQTYQGHRFADLTKDFNMKAVGTKAGSKARSSSKVASAAGANKQ